VPTNILIIDDKPESVVALEAEVDEQMPGASRRLVDFEKAGEAIESYHPDVVILDLGQGAVVDHHNPGLAIRDHIWERRFCPIVFYTAFPDLLKDDERLKHPLIKSVTKGAGSEAMVLACIRQLEPSISAIKDAGREMYWALTRALREVASGVFSSADTEAIPDVLIRSARRRLAARMDEQLSTGGPHLKTWEHYLCPPTLPHLLTGDIICRRNGDQKDPSSYRLVLTPSCDLVEMGTRKPNVEKVLTAVCSDAERLLKDANLSPKTQTERLKEKIKPFLRQGHGKSCLPLPELPHRFPTMVADFRALEVIDINQIGSNKEYERVASVDSPFRELVAWAYALNAARPGMPERDFDSWADEIVKAIPEPEKGSEQT
jgi:hypothetical protein